MSSGGYRYNAGRKATRPRVEDCAVLDVHCLRAMGALLDGDHGALRVVPGWYRTRGHRLHLSHEWGGSLFQVIVFDFTPANLGHGQRAWLRCPQCEGRCMRLYRPPGNDSSFACRVCARVSYPSQRLSSYDLANDRYWALLARLGPNASRPAGMRYGEYHRLRGALRQADHERTIGFAARAAVHLPLAATRLCLSAETGDALREDQRCG